MSSFSKYFIQPEFRNCFFRYCLFIGSRSCGELSIRTLARTRCGRESKEKNACQWKREEGDDTHGTTRVGRVVHSERRAAHAFVLHAFSSHVTAASFKADSNLGGYNEATKPRFTRRDNLSVPITGFLVTRSVDQANPITSRAHYCNRSFRVPRCTH